MPSDLPITTSISIPRRELTVRATRAGGPGGQHVNTSATRVEVVWNVARTAALDGPARERVQARLGARVDGDGNLRVVASASRSQHQNREAAERRLAALVSGALVVPKRRRPTRPTAASRRARLDAKRRQSDRKRGRRGERDDAGDGWG